MKRFLIIAGVICLVLSAAAVAAEQSMLARVTVYWASGGGGSDHWSRNHIAASGARLRSGHCAVDPRRIPYGSKVRMDGDTLVAVDTGGHVKSRRAARRAGRTSAERNAIVVDRFFETKRQALAWAKRHPQFMTVRVDSPNASSVARVTDKRTATPVVKSVVAAAPQKLTPIPATTIPTSIASIVLTPATPGLRNSISTPRTQSVPLVRTNVSRGQNPPLIASNKSSPVAVSSELAPRPH